MYVDQHKQVKDRLIGFGTDTNLARFVHGWKTFSTQPDLVNASPGQDVLDSALFYPHLSIIVISFTVYIATRVNDDWLTVDRPSSGQYLISENRVKL